jgi:ribonuclease PH
MAKIIISKIVPGSNGMYMAKSNGTIWSRHSFGVASKHGRKSKRWRQIKGTIHPNGYIQITMQIDGRPKKTFVHTVILITFRGPRPKGMVSRHYPDKTKTNVTLNNLSWSTIKRNQADRIEHGTSNDGEKNPAAKLNWKSIIKIRKMHKTGKYKQCELAKTFNISQSQISQIVNKNIWTRR